jgi:hypothetical protein
VWKVLGEASRKVVHLRGHPFDDFGAKGPAVFQMTLPGNVPPPSLPGQINFLWRPCVADVDDDNLLEFREQRAPRECVSQEQNT